MELMCDVAPDTELFCAYGFGCPRSRKYIVAPPPPRSTPPEWGKHLLPTEARSLRTKRQRAEQADQKSEMEAEARAKAAYASAKKLARERAKLILVNVARGRAKKRAAADKCAAMREAKRAKLL